MKILDNLVRKRQLIEAQRLTEYMTLDIYAISDLVSFERNEYLVTAGVPSDYLFFVMSGKTICFSYTSSEKNNCVSFTQHQTLVGEASSLFGKPPKFNVKAMSDVLCIAINLNRYRNDLLGDLTFVRNICEMLASKMNNEGRYSTTLLDPLEVRLAQFILLNASDHLFTLQLTDCADALNTSYRHLLRRRAQHQLPPPAAHHQADVRTEHPVQAIQLLLHRKPGCARQDRDGRNADQPMT